MSKMTTCTIAFAIAGAMTIGFAGPSSAAPVLSNTAAVATAVPNAATDVRYYRNGYRRGYRNNAGLIVGGVALGVAGAVAADGYYRNRAYDAPYAYGQAPYGYGYAPRYGYGPQRIW